MNAKTKTRAKALKAGNGGSTAETVIIDGMPYMRLDGPSVVSLMNEAYNLAGEPGQQHAYLTTALVWFCLHHGVGRKRCMRKVREVYEAFHGQPLPITATEPTKAA